MKNAYLLTGLVLLTFSARSQWTPIAGTGNGFVVNLETYNNELYATGFFNTLNGTGCNYVAKWDGTNWQTVGNGFEESGHHLQTIGTELYAVRYEQQIDSNWLYQFDGTDFQPIGEGVYLTTAVLGFSQTANLYNVTEYNGDLIVCGEFDRAGTQSISGIMRRSGNQWAAMGSGLSGHIANTATVMYPHDLCRFGNDLIVSGNFKLAGGQTVNGIARWDGTQWYAMGAGFNSTVYGIAVYNGELYAGGDFTQSGTTPLTNIARWNGTSWEDPGFQLHYANSSNYSYIHTLKVLNNRLFISGGFDRADIGGQSLHCAAIVAYDGTAIDTLQGGLTGKEAEGIALYNGLIHASGGLNGSSYIARYDDVASTPVLPAFSSLTIAPNPAVATVQLNSATPWDAIRVTNALGQVVYQNAHPGTSQSIELKENGVYFVTVTAGGQTTTERVVRL